MLRTSPLLLLAALLSCAPVTPPADAPVSTAAPRMLPDDVVSLPESVQIAAATAPLPEAFRASATVLGYRGGQPPLVTLRAGGGDFVCLAADPRAQRFHTACYHASLEHFMDRGRELRAAGMTAAQVDSVRNAEVLDGRLQMPAHAALYSLTGPWSVLDTPTGAVRGARPLYVLYLPMATAEATGLPGRPQGEAPWLMDSGTPRAHVMFTPRMDGP
jgi:hypothetical protein